MAYLDVFAEQFADVHRELSRIVTELPEEALNWTPYPGANTIAVLLTHVLGNELETLRSVRSLPTDRNRASEFEVVGATKDRLLTMLAELDAVRGDLVPQITPQDLERVFRRPAALGETAHSGLYQLEHSITHASEHYGQICMTRDLWEQRPPE